MITQSDLDSIDKSGMYKVYDNWANIAQDSFAQNNEPINIDHVTDIVFVGMGGSGTIGDILESIFSKTNIHFKVEKGYRLPKTISKNSLVIVTSVSGNTSETNFVLKEAAKAECHLAAFSSGGLIEDFCKNNNLFHTRIPLTHSPRSSLMQYLYSILNSLEKISPISKQEISQSIKDLDNLSKNINSTNLSNDNKSLSLSMWCNNLPAIYYPSGLEASAIRFKNSLQENCKIHAFAEDIIEFCHNGIMSWEQPSTVQPIMIQGPDDHIKTKDRFKIIKEYFETNSIPYRDVFAVSGNILSKLVCLIYLLDYTSIYKSVLSKTDPTPINSIDFIKNQT